MGSHTACTPPPHLNICVSSQLQSDRAVDDQMIVKWWGQRVEYGWTTYLSLREDRCRCLLVVHHILRHLALKVNVSLFNFKLCPKHTYD